MVTDWKQNHNWNPKVRIERRAGIQWLLEQFTWGFFTQTFLFLFWTAEYYLLNGSSHVILSTRSDLHLLSHPPYFASVSLRQLSLRRECVIFLVFLHRHLTLILKLCPFSFSTLLTLPDTSAQLGENRSFRQVPFLKDVLPLNTASANQCAVFLQTHYSL